MLPRVIHYCWFGHSPLPPEAIKCINSWKKYFPDYEIKEWNESNFDINILPYTKEAYEQKKYAFVSDYARFWILYNYGGLYFDTDVEIIAPMDDIIALGPFMGKEIDDLKRNIQAVNPGLCMGALPGMNIYREMLEGYSTLSFLVNGKINSFSMIPMLTGLLKRDGLIIGGGIQCVDDIRIYPPDYFNPWDSICEQLNKTENTRAIHWYSKTWMPKEIFFKRFIRKWLHRLYGMCVER